MASLQEEAEHAISVAKKVIYQENAQLEEEVVVLEHVTSVVKTVT